MCRISAHLPTKSSSARGSLEEEAEVPERSAMSSSAPQTVSETLEKGTRLSRAKMTC